jgi:hypothetical protein|mmetsp:Transcript_42348/g.67038  ORF Transcript_42348/g.67038 Transcript_42348/m.67038 type:complete len:256 (+) Transcript_42348:44-811(+)
MRELKRMNMKVRCFISLSFSVEFLRAASLAIDQFVLDSTDPTPLCEDVVPSRTGFDVHTPGGFLKHAACSDLEDYCANSTIAEELKKVCPVTCNVCAGYSGYDGPCYNAENTGIRFREGPKATCEDLVNYCNSTEIGAQVMQACKLSCGVCGIQVTGPFVDDQGLCEDRETKEEPQFTIMGKLSACSDMGMFCNNHPDSYLVREKCPLTCGVCADEHGTTNKPTTDEVSIAGDPANCDRRRRFGFCSTRRRRNVT